MKNLQFNCLNRIQQKNPRKIINKAVLKITSSEYWLKLMTRGLRITTIKNQVKWMKIKAGGRIAVRLIKPGHLKKGHFNLWLPLIAKIQNKIKLTNNQSMFKKMSRKANSIFQILGRNFCKSYPNSKAVSSN